MIDYINVLKRMDDIYIKFLEDFEASLEREYVAWEAAIQQEIYNFNETGVLNPDFASSLPSYNEEDEKTSDKEIMTTGNNTSKENEVVVEKKTSRRTGRITRQALREPSQLVNQQHDLIKDKASNVVVKVERLTNHVITKYNETAAVQVKKEMDMPPPSKPIRQTKQTRKQKESKGLKIKTELIEAAQIPRDSDVIVQTDNIITLVVDTDEEEAEAPIRTTRARTKNRTKNQNIDVVEVPVTRSTRTKTRAAAMTKIEEIEMAANEQLKRLRDSSPENNETQNKSLNKTKIRKIDDNTISKVNTVQVPQTDVANKVATVNETFVCDNKEKNEDKLVNTTVVIEKPRIEIPNMKDLMTDDEDESPASTKHKQKLKSKTVFSPYENSPVKKKVEAFEKLGAASAASQMPVRNLRAKGKTNDSENASTNKSEGTAVKTRGIPKAIPGSAEKYASKVLTPSTNSTLKPRSALKQSQAAFRERELARQQKEAEARHKKEALLRAEAEEKRRKLEEKQLKAQQQRDALKKEKLKALEQYERAKQEKIKKFSADQEDKLSKKKELNAQKYANAARKAAEEKEKQKDKVQTPKYLKYKTPLLPTADCYDSDDGDSKPIVEKEWQKKDQTTFVATLTRYTKVHNTRLFCSHSQTVDLQEIFPTIEPAKLKRTSSAIWNRSGMIKLASMMEEDDDL